MKITIDDIEHMTVDREGTTLAEAIADVVRDEVRAKVRKLIKDDPEFANRIDALARKAAGL
jgi:hypothetical protein